MLITGFCGFLRAFCQGERGRRALKEVRTSCLPASVLMCVSTFWELPTLVSLTLCIFVEDDGELMLRFASLGLVKYTGSFGSAHDDLLLLGAGSISAFS